LVVVGIVASVHCEICEHMQTIVHGVLHDPIEVNTHSDRVVAWSMHLPCTGMPMQKFAMCIRFYRKNCS